MASILNWLGFASVPLLPELVRSVPRLDGRNFIVIMRKIRDMEWQLVQRVQRVDRWSGTMSMREVVPLMKEMGFELWDVSAIFEAAEDVHMEPEQQRGPL